MENQFLRQVAAAFVANDDLDCRFVLPNRRSMKFFQKFLGQEYGKRWGKPLFSPQMGTINELFIELADLHPADPVEQLYLLYKEYIAIKYRETGFDPADGKDTFDEFVHWGDAILKDFNDIDKYLVDARQLFTNIKELKDIESDFSYLSPRQFEAVKSFWTNYLKGGTLGSKKELFSSIWGMMFELYTSFNKTLEAKGIGYEGQIYRKVAGKVEQYDFERRVVFIGFNAPNRCEKRVMQYLRDCGKGDFYWDFYGPMLTDESNGASEIIKEFVKEFPSAYTLGSFLKGSAGCTDADAFGRTGTLPGGALPVEEQSFNIYAAPSGVGQAFVVSHILEKLFPGATVKEEEAFSTAIVLPDENLLMPVLNSVPHKFGSINVTMGYPITATSLASFMNLVKQLQMDARKDSAGCRFYHKSLLDLIAHEYVKKLCPEDSQQIRKKVLEGNLIYVENVSPVLEGVGELLAKVLVPVEGSGQMLSYMASILEYLDGVLESWDREFVCQYHQRIKRLQQLEIPMETKTCLKLVEQLCNGIVVPFKGEPLKGLQIMGTLETRALDFENVIIVSANEGKFPSSNIGNSIIPYNLRVGFGLPTYELQDGIAAYHFYRSICRARNVHMVYDTRSEGLSSGEVSRYVKQLKYHFGIKVNEMAVSVPPVQDNGQMVLKVEKRGAVMEKMMEMFTGDGEKSLSASALNNYIACPLKFYVENVEGIVEEDEVAESVESNVFGSIFHYVMEGIYRKYEGKRVSVEDIRREKRDSENIGKLILEGFVKYMHTGNLTGQHRIVEALLVKYIGLALDADIKAAPFRYVAGERRFKYRLPLWGGGLEVNFKAFIDRIDTLVEGNITRIIDYKTGSVTAPNSKFEIAQLFDKEGDGKYKAVAQLYLYALIMFDEKLVKGEDIDDVLLTIYQLKKIAKEEPVQILLEQEGLEQFKELLVECVEEIFNEDIPFYANPQEKNCGYCKLQAICRK